MLTQVVTVHTQTNTAVGEAFARLQERLRSYLLKHVSDRALAEDLLQDVFVKALRFERSGRRIENWSGWLYATARTTLIDHYRASGRTLVELDENTPNDDADDTRLHQEIAACMAMFVEQLPAMYRDTLVATDLQGQTMRVVAEQQGVSVSAIKSRAVRGRAMLKDQLLACCHVEMTDGLVSDYHPRERPSCGPSTGSGAGGSCR